MQIRELFNEFPIDNHQVVPIELQRLLNEPIDVTQDWQRAEGLLLDAIELLPHRLEVRVALYKMYAYSNRFEDSMQLIHSVLAQAAEQEGFSSDWRTLSPQSTCWHPAEGAKRLFLYSMKATGFVSLRMGNVALAVEVLDKLQELDPQDQVGGSVVREMASRLLEDDEVA